MSVDAVRNWLAYLNFFAGALLIARILWTGLYRIHPFFLAYLLAESVQRALRIVNSGNHGQEQLVYMAGEALNIVLITLTIREVSRVSFDPYPGLAEFLKRTSGYLVLASASVAVLSAALDPSVSYTKNHLLPHFYTFERTVYSALLLYLLAVSAFMAWFPVRIRRKVAIFIGGFAAFFAAQCAALLTLNRTRQTATWLGVITLAVSLVCTVSWIVALFTPVSEEAIVTGIRWNPANLARLTRQLEGINASLLRFVRGNLE